MYHIGLIQIDLISKYRERSALNIIANMYQTRGERGKNKISQRVAKYVSYFIQSSIHIRESYELKKVSCRALYDTYMWRLALYISFVEISSVYIIELISMCHVELCMIHICRDQLCIYHFSAHISFGYVQNCLLCMIYIELI